MNKKLKTTLIILIVLLFVSLSIWLINKANVDKPFNKVTFTKDNFVKNNTDMVYLDTLVLAGLHSLNINKTSVLILPLKIKNSGDVELKANIVHVENGYVIFIKNVDRTTSLEIVSHELIHLQQYESGDLHVNHLTNEIIFKKKTYSINNLPEYNLRPWEVEAFGKQSELRLKLVNFLY